jgi:hypothetical protein
LVPTPLQVAWPGGIFRMDEATNADGRFHGYRFPAIIIGEVVWLRLRFNEPARI